MGMVEQAKLVLKPCPFCGRDVSLEVSEAEGCKTQYDIYCYGKPCFRPINNFPFESKKEAIIAWNLRANV